MQPQATQQSQTTQPANNGYVPYNSSMDATGQYAQPHANFFERMLPTIAGIGGSILGGLAMPFGGEVAGGAAGGALGQELENKLTGSKQSTLSAGVENGLGSVLGGIGGKVIGGIASKAGNIATTGASKLFAGQGPGIGKDLSDYATQHLGINDLQKAAQFGKVLSGSTSTETNADNGLISKAVADLVKTNGPKTIDLSGLYQAPFTGKTASVGEQFAKDNQLQQILDSNGLGQSDSANAIRSQLRSIFSSANNPGSVSSEDTLKMQKMVAGFTSKANDIASTSREEGAIQKAAAWNDINTQFKSALGLDTMKVSPDYANVLAKDIITNGSSIDKNAATTVAKDITDAANSEDGLTVGQLRNLEQNHVRLQTAAEDASKLADKNFGTSAAGMARQTLPVAASIAGIGGPKSVLGTIGGMVTSNPSMDKLGSSALSNLAQGAKGKLVQKVLPLATRAAAIGVANLPNIAGSGTTGGASPENNVLSGAGTNMTPTAMSPIDQAYQIALAGAGVNPQSASLLGTLTPIEQKLSEADALGNNLLTAYNNAGGAQGLGGGVLSQISSLIPGTAANNYLRNQNATSSGISSLLGIPSSAIASSSPLLMQNPTTASIPMSNISNILGTIGAY